jgi:redox-sensitive bicupin YhaK (pirin superfamily)
MSAETSIELVIEGRRRDLGGFEVGRVLPWTKRRSVGPFVFFDHMGPKQMGRESAAAGRRAAASAHRAVDDHLPVRRRDRPSRQASAFTR